MNVFISSTFQDLWLERNAVALALEKKGYHAAAQEDCVPLYELPLKLCLEDVAGSDLYIAIIAWRYGSVPEGHEKSFVHLEYQEAQINDIPRIIFLLNKASCFAGTREDSNLEKVRNLRSLMEKEKYCFNVKESECLFGLVDAMLHDIIKGIMSSEIQKSNKFDRIRKRIAPYGSGYTIQFRDLLKKASDMRVRKIAPTFFITNSSNLEEAEYFQDYVRYKLLPETLQVRFVSFRINITKANIKLRNSVAEYINAYIGNLFLGKSEVSFSDINNKLSALGFPILVRCYIDVEDKNNLNFVRAIINYWSDYPELDIIIFIHVYYGKSDYEFRPLLQHNISTLYSKFSKKINLYVLDKLQPVQAKHYVRMFLLDQNRPDEEIEKIVALVPEGTITRKELVKQLRYILE